MKHIIVFSLFVLYISLVLLMSCEGSPKQKSVIQKKDEKITKVSGEKHTLNTIDNKLDIIIKTQNQYTKSMKNDIKEMKGIISTKNITNNPWPYVICFVAFLTFLFIDPAYSRFGLKRRKE